MSALSVPLFRRGDWPNKRLLGPTLAGIVASLAMISIYLVVLTLLQDWQHATEQFAADRWFVLLVAFGFGVQIGLYAYLRLVIHGAQSVGASAATGAGTSTLGMVACCAHHLTDIAPLVALTGASGLTGAISFLTEYKYGLIALGLVVNVIGSVITFSTIRKSHAHLRTMSAQTAKLVPASTCH
jgi:hypothetical protein